MKKELGDYFLVLSHPLLHPPPAPSQMSPPASADGVGSRSFSTRTRWAVAPPTENYRVGKGGIRGGRGGRTGARVVEKDISYSGGREGGATDYFHLYCGTNSQHFSLT